MDHRIASARPLGRALAATLAGIALAAAAAILVAPPALAQTKPAAKKQPAKPAPKQMPEMKAATPPTPPTAAQQPPQLMYSPWMKVCGKGKEPNAKEVCVITKDGRLENGMPVAVVQLFEPEGDKRKLLRVTVPLGMQLAHGTRVIIDQGSPATAPYTICFPVGCMSDYEVNAATIDELKKGKTLMLQAINMQGTPISLPIPLNDFAKAYDGKPIDPKVFEAQQKKLQSELQKKAEEARKKLEAQHPTAQAPAQKK